MTSHGEARKLRRSHSRPGAHPSVAWKWSLESGLRSKDSRAVRRRVVGKVPIEATRWRPILPGCPPEVAQPGHAHHLLTVAVVVS